MTNKTAAPFKGASRVVLAIAMAGCCAFAQSAPAPQATATTDPAAAASPAAAEPETALAPVTVSAQAGLAVPYDQTGVSVSVVDIPELKKEGITTLNNALLTVSGVAVTPDGDDQRGNVGSIAIRGMNSGQYTLPMIDGMRLYSFSNGVNITPNVVGRTDLFSLGTLEVLRGAQGAVYGPGAVGGVLYMETPEGQGKPSLTIFNEYGSGDSYTGNIVAQGQVKKLSFYVSATYTRTNNDIEFADGRKITAKHAGHYEGWNEAIRLDYAINDNNKLTLTYRREDAEYKYFSTDYGYGSYLNDYEFCSNLLTAKYQTKLTDRYSSSLMAGYYGVDNMYGHGYNYNLRNVQIEWRNNFQWNDKNVTTAGFAWNRSDYRCLVKEYDMDMNDSLDNTYGFFAEHTYRPTKHWDNSVALRWDQSSIYDGQFSFRAATNYRFNRDRTRAYASVGSGYKTPSALQRDGVYQSVYGYTYRGNGDLDCEHNISVDFGLEQQIAPNHYVSATFFWTRIEDGIGYDYTHPDYVTWKNASGHWTSQGVELAIHGTWEKRWNTGYRLGFTYTQPKTSDDVQIASTARQVWSGDIHTSPFKGLTTGIGFLAVTGRNDYNSYRLDDYYTLRWYANYEVNEHLSFHIRVENLTDQKFISESNGGINYWTYETGDFAGSIIGAGVSVFGGCTIKF